MAFRYTETIMETIVRHVRDLHHDERSALERLVGHSLLENQQLVIQILSVTPTSQESAPVATETRLPDWCNVFEGLSDAQIADIEAVALQRAVLSRSGD